MKKDNEADMTLSQALEEIASPFNAMLERFETTEQFINSYVIA